jgi:hypothetical protein
MPFELSVSPSILLAMWAGGIAAAAAFVARWKVVGAGFLWTAGGAALLAGAAASTAGPWGVAAVATLLGGVAVARKHIPAAVLFGISAVSFLVHGFVNVADNPLLILTGAVALGGTTAEMLLGHWFLVDPKLPRWALRRLDGAGIAGLTLDTAYVVWLGGLSGEGLLRWAYLGLAAMSVLMMTGVWFSLKEKGYEGVMAATGLSYLSVLTALGAVAMGRFLVA